MNRRVILLLALLVASRVRAASRVLPGALVGRSPRRGAGPVSAGIGRAPGVTGSVAADNLAAPAIELRSGWVLAQGDR
jgi:hypothetical protein